MAIPNPTIQKIVEQKMNEVFEEVYSNHSRQILNFKPYMLEQCGKLYRVKKNTFGTTEYKSGWLKLNEAQAIKKLMEVSEDGTS